MTAARLQQGVAGTLHAIETLQWNSRGTSDREHAHAHQVRLSAFLSGPGLQTIERVFSRLSPPGEVWQQDSLEIDTGPMQADGSFAQWSEVLEHQLWDTLWRARHEQGDARPAGVLTADDHALEHFLYYLQHGHLPWARSALAGRELSAWLARLARRTGAALWVRLRQLQPGEYVEARLSQIAPCEGLQALLAVRHRELADSLDSLDAQLLAPLQARGRLSAYQVRQLRQRWRVAGFRVLWAEHAGSLGADALRRLQRELGLALATQLGRGGLGAWRPGAGGGKEFGQRLLLGVLDVVASPSGQRSDAPQGLDAMTTVPREPDGVGPLLSEADSPSSSPDAEDGDPETRADTDWQRISMALDGRHPLDAPTFRSLLRGLCSRDAEGVRARLRVEGQRHQSRQAWFERLGAEAVWEVMRVMADDAPVVGEAPSAAGASWAESLRQFALAALADGGQPGGGRKAGLSALQAWLADYSLREWLLGGNMPRDPRGWRQLWRRALAEWRGQTPAKVRQQGGQARERHAASIERGRTQRETQRDTDAYATKIGEEGDATGGPQQTVGRPQRAAAARQADRTPPPSLPAHEAARSTDDIRIALPGLTLSERYLRAMRELAAQSRAVPPSALFARWRVRLHRFVEAQPDGLGVAHFAASRDTWRGELGGDGTPTEAARVGGATRASPVSQSRLLARWLAGAASPGSAAAWAILLRMPDCLRAELLPRLRRRAWRAHVARHWTTARKLELLVLTDAAWGRERLTHWQTALEHWQWLPRAISVCAAGPASADGTTIGRLRRVWLWEATLQWATEQGPRIAGSAAEGDLYAHWLHRLRVQADTAIASRGPMSLSAAMDAVRHALQTSSIGPGLRFVVLAPPRARAGSASGAGMAPERTTQMPQPWPDSPTAVSRLSHVGEENRGATRPRATAVASPRAAPSPTEAADRAGAGDAASTAAPMQPATSARWLADALAGVLPDVPAAKRAMLHEHLYAQAVAGAAPAWRALAFRYARALHRKQPMRFVSTAAATRGLASAGSQSCRARRIVPGNGARHATPWLPAALPVRTHRIDLSRAPARRLPIAVVSPRQQDWKAFAELASLSSPAARLVRILALPSQSPAPLAWTARRQVAGWLADAALCGEWLARTHSAERWTLLAMLFPAHIATLRRSSRMLRVAHAHLLPDLPTSARADSHWAFLVDHLLLSSLPAAAPLLVRRYAMHLYREDCVARGTAAMSFEHWLARLAQALDASGPPGRVVSGGDAVRAPVASRSHRTTMCLDAQALRQPPDAAEQWEASQILGSASASAGTVAPAIGHTSPQVQQESARTPANPDRPPGETTGRQTALPEPPSPGNSPDEAATQQTLPRRAASPEPAGPGTPTSNAALRRLPPQAPPPAVPFGPRAAPPASASPPVLPDVAGAGSHYVANAGLVLLANYTQRLFDMLNLRDGPQWRDAASQSRAVRCLAYLVDGHEAGSEPEWVLPKLLCGMPLAQPLTDESGLDRDTRALLDSLLQAVIAHWTALGRTSVAGLRETFLRRDGRLQRETAQAGALWRLVVRPGPFDMLLDRLPWSYATIKLPWMKEVLYVDWR